MKTNDLVFSEMDRSSHVAILRKAHAIRAEFLRSLALETRKSVADFFRSFGSKAHKTA